MEAQRFRVVLKGEIMEGYDRGEAIRALAALFGQPPERLRAIFPGKPIPLKQELEPKQAKQIQDRLHSVGVKCTLEPVGTPPVRPPPTLAEGPAPKAVPQYDMQIVCPKCGHRQQGQSPECPKCGIVFSKWKEEKRAQEEAQQGAGYGLNEEQLLHLFVDSNADKYLRKFQHFRAARGYAFTWHWPALFVAPFWAIYRKMWGWAAIILVSLIFPFAFLIWPATANYIYFRHAQNRLQRLGSRPDEGRVALAGGTSPMALLAALGVCLGLWFAGWNALKAHVGTGNFYAQAAANAREQVPDSAEGRKTLLMLRTTALVVDIWAASGKDVGTVSTERLASDLQQPVENFRDGWGNTVRVSPTVENFIVTSAGPDGVFDSTDDMRYEPPLRQ